MKIRLTLKNGQKKLASFEFEIPGECSEQIREAIYQAFVRGLAVKLDYEDMPWGIKAVVRDRESCALPGRERITGEDRDLSKILEGLRKPA